MAFTDFVRHQFGRGNIMVNWHIYNNQSYQCKQLASQALIGDLLAHINTKIVYRLPFWLEERSDDHNTIEKMKRNKYFYKKYNGELIKKRKAIRLIDTVKPNITDILSHPLWSLLSSHTNSHNKLLMIAKRLPFTVQSHILSREGNHFIYRDNVLKFLNMNTYDAFTGTLLVFFAHSEQLTNKEKHQISAALLRFIIRFITPKNVKLAVELNVRLIQLLKLPINEVSEETCTFTLHDKNFSLPIYLNPSFDVDNFKMFLNIYEMLYRSIIDTKRIKRSNASFEKVTTHINHQELPALTKKLDGKLPKPKHRVFCPLNQLIRRFSYDATIDEMNLESEPLLNIHLYRY